MSLSKNKIVDKCETIAINNGSHYVLQIRERNQILEDGLEISSSFHRYALNPDADISTITDPVVLAQFSAVMTDQVKTNYQAFLAAQQNKGLVK